MSKSMSKMNKSELYTLAKQQKEELMTASLFNNSLEEEFNELKLAYDKGKDLFHENRTLIEKQKEEIKKY